MKASQSKGQKNQQELVSAKSADKSQNSSESTFQFVDGRPEAIAQRKLQENVNSSPQARHTAQLQALADNSARQQQQPIQKKENKTGLPDQLKSGMENLSGHSMDDVKVHYNSDKPAQLNAHAYAQGSEIHLASGQEKHLPHEAWHVVQQKQGRVKPTMQLKSNINVNDDVGLEREADIMGSKLVSAKGPAKAHANTANGNPNKDVIQQISDVIQYVINEDFSSKNADHLLGVSNPVHQLMLNDNKRLQNMNSLGSFPRSNTTLQRQLYVGKSHNRIKNPGTIRDRAGATGASNQAINVLIRWAKDNKKNGRVFDNWAAAVHAAGQEAAGDGWTWRKTAVLLFVLLLVVGVPLAAFVMLPSGQGSSSGHDSSGTGGALSIPPGDLHQINQLRHNANIASLRNMSSFPQRQTVPASGSNFKEMFPGAKDFCEVEEHLKAVEPLLEELSPVLKSKRSQIEKRAKAGKSKSSGHPPKKAKATPEKETIVNEKGHISFGSPKDQSRFDKGGGGKVLVETKAIKNLLKSTKTGKGITGNLQKLGQDPLFLREDLGHGVSGEADPRENRFIKLHSKRGYVQNTIIAAHELKHREQFAMGQIDQHSNPYRLATAEIFAKKVGLDMYKELHKKGFIPPMDKDTQDQEFDLKDQKKDPKAYERQVFRLYQNLYSKADTKAYPKFKSDAALDKHIADQKAYFAAKENLFKVEKAIKDAGHYPDNMNALPKKMKEELLEARAINRKARRKASKSQPK